MRSIRLSLIVAMASLSPGVSHACSQSVDARAFDKVAPGASDIVAVQVESLALEPNAMEIQDQHTFHGRIRVLKHYRGSGEFTDIKYWNSRFGGLRLDVGGIYLIATSLQSTTLDLNTPAAPILHLSGFFTFDPDLVLRLSPTVKQLEAALKGEGTFELTTDATTREMSIFTPPPPVPPPVEADEQ